METLFRTTEFPLAISILYFKIPMEAIDRDPKNPSKLTFVFSRSEELDKIVEKFWKKELSIEPNSYHNASRELKSRMRTSSLYGDNQR